MEGYGKDEVTLAQESQQNIAAAAARPAPPAASGGFDRDTPGEPPALPTALPPHMGRSM